jgi:WD40 repeat protein
MSKAEQPRKPDSSDESDSPPVQVKIDQQIGAITGSGKVTGLEVHYAEKVIVEAGQAAAPPEPGDPPYKGLNFYDVADAPIFFGREKLTAELVAFVRDQAFLAVVGDSGSGKSSLARAGLIAALLGKVGRPLEGSVQPPLGSRDWRYVSVTPTAQPFETLARALVGEGTKAKALLKKLRANPLALCDRATTLVEASGRLLLLVDQFEELFTLCKDEAERVAYINALLAASGAPSFGVVATPFTVILTVRADFYTQCGRHEALRNALETHQKYIGAMNRGEIQRTIELPAEGGQWAFQQGLVEQILEDVGDEPGNLPLLSHALLETWKRRSGRVMTLAGYQAAGGVDRAISQTADRVFDDLVSQGLGDVARRIFLSLVDPREEGRATRRREQLRDLAPEAGDSQEARTLLALSARDARLVTVDKETVQISHEALITAWPKLDGWLRTYSNDLQLLDGIRDATAAWQAAPEAEKRDLLAHRGGRLDDALKLRDSSEFTMGEQEREYLAACVSLRDWEEEEKEAQRLRELKLAQEKAAAEGLRAAEAIRSNQRLRTRNRIITAIGLMAMVAALAAMFFAWQTRQQTQLSRSRELSAVALGQIDIDPERAILIALEGVQSAPTLEAIDTLRQALAASRARAVLRGHRGQVNRVHFSPDGKQVMTTGNDGTARLWDAVTGKELAILDQGSILGAQFVQDGPRVVVAGENYSAAVWDVEENRQLALLAGLNEDILRAQFSEDGSRVATISAETVRVWDIAKQQTLAVLQAPPEGFVNAVFSSDGTRLATTDWGNTARIWDIATGKEIATLSGHEKVIVSIQFGLYDKRVATASRDGTARVWDATSGELLSELRGHGADVVGVQFSPYDGKWVLTASTDGTARVWNVAKGKVIVVLSGQNWAINEAQFSPDGLRVVTAGSDNTARVWDISSGLELVALRGHTDELRDAQFSPDGRWVATASRDGTARVWDTLTVEGMPVLRGHNSGVYTAQFSPDGNNVLTAGQDKTVRIWDAYSGQELAVLSGHTDDVYDARYSPDGRLLVTASKDNTARVWDIATKKELAILGGHTDYVSTAQFSPDGKRVITASWDGTACIWEAGSWQRLFTLQGHSGWVLDAQFSPDGRKVATASSDDTARIWDASSGQELFVLRGHSADVRSVQFSPDGSRLVTASEDGTARVWELATGQELSVLSGHEGVVMNALFSPDGKKIATASRDGSARIWDASTGKELVRLLGHAGEILSVQFSPDGRWVVTASEDDTARVWEVASGQIVAVLRGHTGDVKSASFSPDSKQVVTASWDKTARVHRVSLEDLLALASQHVTRQLTCLERVQLLHDNLVCPTPTVLPTSAP